MRGISRASLPSLAVFIGAVLLGAAIAAPSASACAACACGDPTLTVMGIERPFAGRLRVGAELRYRAEAEAVTKYSQHRVDEAQLVLLTSFAPLDWVMLSLEAPLTARRVSARNLDQELGFGFGDAEARARFVLFQERTFRPEHQAGLTASLRVPTGTRLGDDLGLASPDAMPGAGAWIPQAGVFYGFTRLPYSVFASSSAYVASPGWGGIRPGPGLLTSVTGQFQPLLGLAVRGGIDTRIAMEDTVGTTADPNTGGFAAFASMGLTFSPLMDLLLYSTVRMPVLLLGPPGRWDGPIVLAGVIYDV